MANPTDKFELVAGEWLEGGQPLVLPLEQPWPRRLVWEEGAWKIIPEGGFNVFVLMAQRAQRQASSVYWLSVREGEKAGGQLRPDAVGVTVARWRWTAREGEFKGDITPRMVGVVEDSPEAIELDEEQKAVAMRPMVLFNASSWDFPDGAKLPEEPHYRLPTPTEAREAAERILSTEADCKIRHQGVSAYYNPSLNEIVLPPVESFKSLKEYYWTAFEQLGHAIAGKHQMDLWKPQGGLDFSNNLTIKRLYARMVAAMFAYESGIDVL